MKRYLVLTALLFLPMLASAAGFVQAPLFLSKSPVTEGQKIKVYAIVSNGAATAFSGTVVISADGTKLSSPAATLAAGATQTVSSNWTPTAGEHTVTAQLTAGDGTVVQQVSQNFTVQAVLKPADTADTSTSNQGTTPVQSSAGLQQSLANISPTTAEYSKPVFTAIDSGRVFAAGQLNKAVDWSKERIGSSATPKTPFKNATTSTTQSGAANTAWTIFATLSLYILSILLYIVGNAGIFYPVLAIAFLYFLWKMFRRFRRPRY